MGSDFYKLPISIRLDTDLHHGAPSPTICRWSEAFIEKHASGKKDVKEIARAQLRAATPSLQRIFAKSGEKAIAEAYAHGYRLNEIASHLDVHYATVSRRLKRIEEAN